ncbi:hypothetical protein L3V83_06510 [Thiotrichales bacterium 19X7-9]|nr:hypothetical protein [Thiotrichales bacterium 19X7-9]
MKSVLFCIPLKADTLEQYLTFADETTERSSEYSDMLKRYDIHCAKIWHSKLENKDYVFVYHEVGPSFKEKMLDWDNSKHPFDVWFRNNIMAVYDITSAASVTEPNYVLDFKA